MCCLAGWDEPVHAATQAAVKGEASGMSFPKLALINHPLQPSFTSITSLTCNFPLSFLVMIWGW